MRQGVRLPAARLLRIRAGAAKRWKGLRAPAPVSQPIEERISPPSVVPPVPVPPGPAVAGSLPSWQPADEWRMMGANAGHTARVTSRLHLPLAMAWYVTPEQLGAAPGAAAIHPRAIAGKTVLVEMDLPGSIVLAAIDAASGRVRWTKSFSSPGFFPDAGLFVAADDAGAEVFLEQVAPGAAEPRGWNLTRLSIRDGKPIWQAGDLTFEEALHAPAGCHTLFRPVVQAGTQLLVTPDFFGRPPLVAFDVRSGVVQWRSNAAGGDPPVILDDPHNPVALTADYAGGRPVIHATILGDGTVGPALVGQPAGTGPDWTGGMWDVRVRWADPDASICCVSGGRLRTKSSWPSASWVLSTPGAPQTIAWEALGQGSLVGPIEDCAIFLKQVVLHDGVKLSAMARVNLQNGHTIWARMGNALPMVAAPELILGRNAGGQLTAWLTATGDPAWYFPLQGLQGCIAGEGEVIASYGDPSGDPKSPPSSEDAAVVAFR